MAVLEEAKIRRRLPADANRLLSRLELFDAIDSTSSYLLEQPGPDVGCLHIAIANRQTAGRGRGEKQWHSPAGGGLWMSGAYTFAVLPENLSALTIAIGVGAANSLEQLGVKDICLKWPNDLLIGGRKLGGILLDSTAAGAANLTVVCGLGINTDLGDAGKIAKASAQNNDLLPIDLKSVLAKPPGRHRFAAAMIGSLAATLRQYATDGFSPFAADWDRLDWLKGRHIVVTQQQQVREGVAGGIADNGALIVRDGEGDAHHIVSGTVRLADDRKAPRE